MLSIQIGIHGPSSVGEPLPMGMMVGMPREEIKLLIPEKVGILAGSKFSARSSVTIDCHW
jgi:hypothetical protein